MTRYYFSEEKLNLVKIKYLTQEIHTGDQGVYAIYNLNTHKFYIGSSNDLISRRSAHFVGLSENNHSNKYLQRSWDKHGESSFVFIILEFVIGKDWEFLLSREQHYLNFYKPYKRPIGYNISEEAGVGIRISGTEHQKKMLERTIKRFTVISPSGKVLSGSNAFQFCKEYNIPYVSFCYMLKDKAHTAGGWRNYKNQELNGEGNVDISKMIEKEAEKKVENHVEKYRFYKDGQLLEIVNLTKFCRENSLCVTTMTQTFHGIRLSDYKGYISAKNDEIAKIQSELPKNFYRIETPDKQIIEISSIRKFAIENGLDRNKFYKGIHKNEGWNGWRLLSKKTKYRQLSKRDRFKEEKPVTSLI